MAPPAPTSRPTPTKLTYDACTRFLADADHTTRLAHMLAPEPAAKLPALIDPHHAMATPAALSEAVHKDTVYITVVDRDGMAVSLIYSIFWGFGSEFASSRFEIAFQNRGAGFSLTPVTRTRLRAANARCAPSSQRTNRLAVRRRC